MGDNVIIFQEQTDVWWQQI